MLTWLAAADASSRHAQTLGAAGGSCQPSAVACAGSSEPRHAQADQSHDLAVLQDKSPLCRYVAVMRC